MANYLKEKETSLSSDLQFEKPELLKYIEVHITGLGLLERV